MTGDYLDAKSKRLSELDAAENKLADIRPKLKRSLDGAYQAYGLDRDTVARPRNEPVAKRTRSSKEDSMFQVTCF